MSQKYSLRTLSAIIAQVVHFAWDDYGDANNPAPGGTMPDDLVWNISYICSCFLAQHTRDGDSGVEHEVAKVGLKVDQYMPFEDRLALAEALVMEFGGMK